MQATTITVPAPRGHRRGAQRMEKEHQQCPEVLERRAILSEDLREFASCHYAAVHAQ